MARMLIKPPRLRTNSDAERHATWLELFFDLVFVVAISELAIKLKADISWDGVLGFVALFVPVWWAWVGTTFYNTRFDTDDLLQRLLVFFQIATVAALAVTIPTALGPSSANFALSYVVVRFILILQYLRAARDLPIARPLTIWYGTGFAIAALIWLVSVFVPTPLRFALWAIAMGVDIGTPLTFAQRSVTLPPNSSHIPERFGLLTLIVLGEGVAGVVRSLSLQQVNILAVVGALLGLGVVFCLWWIYFDHIDGSAIRSMRTTHRFLFAQIWMYTHLPFLASITAGSVAGELVARADPLQPLPDDLRWLLCTAFVVSFIALGLIQLTTTSSALHEHIRRQIVYRFAAAAFTLTLAIFGGGLPALVFSGLLFAISAAQVILDLYGEAHEEPEGELDAESAIPNS